MHPEVLGIGDSPIGPLFDTDAQNELIDAIGEDAFFSLLAFLPEEADSHFTEIEDAVNCGDLTRARVAAHSLKGMASSCTAVRIAAEALAIEQMADANSLAPEIVLPLAEAIKETKAWISQAA